MTGNTASPSAKWPRRGQLLARKSPCDRFDAIKLIMRGQARWAMRWKPATNAFAITVGDRFPAAETY